MFTQLPKPQMFGLLVVAFLACATTAQGAVAVRIQSPGENLALTSGADEWTQMDNGESSAECPDESSPRAHDEQENPFAGSGTSSSTTTSSSGGSPAGSSNTSMNPHARVPSDLSLTGWVLGEAFCGLPNPPGTELLKPPQS